jgi:pilus assembly protein CpaE
LAARSKKRVAIVDLDLQFGDVGVAMDLRGANSVIDLAAQQNEIDEAVIDDMFVRHDSGVCALVAPEQLGAADSIDPSAIVRAIDAMRDHFPYIVCDLWSSLDELTLAVLRSADQILLVTTPELPALKNVRRATAATALLGDERTQIVLNRHPGKAGVSISDVEKNLARRVAATIPSEGVGVTDAINQGISLFDSRARVRTSSNYLRLADALLKQATPRQPKPVVLAARA